MNCDVCKSLLIDIPKIGFPFGCDCGKHKADSKSLEMLTMMVLLQLRKTTESFEMLDEQYSVRDLIESLSKKIIKEANK